MSEMNRNAWILAWIFVVLFSSAPSAFADDVTLRLGQPVTERTIDPGELSVTIRDLIPAKPSLYTVEWEKRLVPVPPLERDGARAADADCPSLLDNFFLAEDESKVASEIEKAPERCKSDLIDATDWAIDDIGEVHRGEEVEIRVTRSQRAAQGDLPALKAKTWTFILTTGSAGEWDLIYGFTLVPNFDDDYFTLQNPEDPEQFIVTEGRDRDGRDLKFLPSLLYSYTPSDQLNKEWPRSFTAGFGHNLSEPAVLIGWGWTKRRNIMLTVGLAAVEEQVLKGRYENEAARILSQALDSDDLTEGELRANIYFGVAFRFGSSPFGKSGDDGGGGKKGSMKDADRAPEASGDKNDTKSDPATSTASVDTVRSRLEKKFTDFAKSEKGVGHSFEKAPQDPPGQSKYGPWTPLVLEPSEADGKRLVGLVPDKEAEVATWTPDLKFQDVDEIWLIVPAEKKFMVFKRFGSSWNEVKPEFLKDKSTVYSGSVIEGLQIDTAELWKKEGSGGDA